MRRARVRTTHGTPRTASIVADAVVPDNTDSMTTRLDGAVVETTSERETTGGLHASVDDYVVNLTVAERLADERDAAHDTDTTADGHAHDAQTDDYTDNTDTTHE